MRYTGKEDCLHIEKNSIYSESDCLEDADSYKDFLWTFYKTIISNSRWDESKLFHLYNKVNLLSDLFDITCLDYKEWLGYQSNDKKNISERLKPSFTDYEIDYHYPNLQPSDWSKKRAERFGGKISLLTQEEVYSTYSVLSNIFNHKTLKEWKGLLKRWTCYALDNQSILEDNNYSIENILDDYELLVKLIEVSWLNQKKENDILAHDHMPWFDIHNYPVFGTMEFIINPYDTLFGFFHAETLSSRKSVIRKWMKAAIDEAIIWEGLPGHLVGTFRSVQLLIECCWLIKKLGPNYPKNWDHVLTTYSSIRASRATESHKYYLDSELRLKPENFLISFFEKYSMECAFKILFECLWSALGHDGLGESSEDEVKTFRGDLIRLIECAYFIQSLKFPERKY